MNFCNNCGADLRQHNVIKFCYNCGNQIEIDIQRFNFPISNSENINFTSPSRVKSKSSFEGGYNSYGIIFTNLNALANRLNCEEDEVKSVILNYISKLEECGHQYLLLDSGNNSYTNISADDGWQSHVELLKDFHNDNSQAEYLFIIGGHDVIPMAIIDNEPRCYKDDYEIDTDLPYCYLIENNFENLLWDGSIFKNDIKLFCGRLPVPSDRSLNDIESYLSNSSNVISGGLATEYCFGMTAKSWERASNAIIK